MSGAKEYAAHVLTQSFGDGLLRAAVDAAVKARPTNFDKFLASFCSQHSPATSSASTQPPASDDTLATAAKAYGSAQESGWSMGAWLGSLALHEPLGTVLSPPAGTTDVFEFAKNGLADVLDERLAAAKCEGLAASIRRGLEELREQQAATGEELASKFSSDGEAAFELQYASLASFYRGLDGIIGAATMSGEPPTIYGQLEREHCSSMESDVPFKTPQTRGKAIVLPYSQWQYVIVGADELLHGDKAARDGTRGVPGRNGEPLAVYEKKMAAFNVRLESKGHTGLAREELICGRL